MKKFLVLTIATISLSIVTTQVFADDDKKELSISIDDKDDVNEKNDIDLDIDDYDDDKIVQALAIKNAKSNKISTNNNVKTDKNKKIYVNNKLLNISDSIVYESRLFLPVRALSDALGLKVDYLADKKIVILDNGKIQLPINENKAVVNGKIVSIDNDNDDVGTIVVGGKTYLPVRFISESLGYSVDYDAKNGIVKVNSK